MSQIRGLEAFTILAVTALEKQSEPIHLIMTGLKLFFIAKIIT